MGRGGASLDGGAYGPPVFLRKAALRPVPNYAVVDPHFIDLIEQSLEADEDELQEALDRGYRELDRMQPHLAPWMAEELASGRDELVQSVGYFLSITVFMAFREAFPTRLVTVAEGDIRVASELLAVDETLRANDPHEILESDDVIAMGQPALLGFIQHHVEEAMTQAEGDIELDELDRVYRALLVEVIALSHSVKSPTGELGPSREMLA